MSSTKKHPPLFRIGDWVSFDYGPKKVFAKVLEDRGPLGVRGRRLYRVQPDDQLGEASAFEMPEDELVTASPPVRQSYEVRYHREGGTNAWRATTKVGEVYRGVKAKGAVGYSTAFWEGESKQGPSSATVSVLLEVDPQFGEPEPDIHPNVDRAMVDTARAMADEMFLSRHPRAQITHASLVD
jgi:hypothetical protein